MICLMFLQYGIVEFNVPLDTLQVISESILWLDKQTDSVTALKDNG